MLLRLMSILVITQRTLLAERLMIYNNAQFQPIDVQSQLIDTMSVETQDICKCQCLSNSLCVTTNFIGISKTCLLYNVPISQGEIRVVINSLASVITLPNRISDASNSSVMIEWLFDDNLNDVYGHYNGILTENNTALWISPGYNGYGSAVYFPFKNYSLVDSYLDLTNINFTISAWIMIPHCEGIQTDRCLHTAILDGTMYFGFFTDDLSGNTLMNSNQWYHVAYVYDRSASEQIIYLNGIVDGYRTPDGSYKGNTSQMALGSISQFFWETYNNGYVDKLTFVARVKSDNELLYEATAVAYYSFDNTYLDFGPNQMNNSSSVNTIFTSSGQLNQALIIHSMYLSYFQTTGFYYLGQTNYSYSFSLWIYPFINNGTILQVSSSNGWCIPMIGFNNAGELTIQTLSSTGIYATSWISRTLPLYSWTHVTMTYSISNGIQLFVNGSLVNANGDATDYLASGEFCTIVLGTGLPPNLCSISQTQIIPTQFGGIIDELRIYSRELSANEISQLASL